MRPIPLATLRADKCSTGCPQLDCFLRGGIPCGSLTELVGEAAACKTQLCLQLLLSAVKPTSQGGLEGRALYIYTEGDPPIKRLQELVAHQCNSNGPLSQLNSIYIERNIYSPNDLLQRLEQAWTLLQQHAAGPQLRLIIIDSIAHIFRDPGDGDGATVYVERMAMLFQLATLLKRIADQYNLAVITTNQVMDAFDDPRSGMPSSLPPHTGGMRLISSGREVVPALGLAWANCMNTRLFLSKGPEERSEEHQGVLRCMQVVFSPSLPQSYCYYRVLAQGVFGIPASTVEQAAVSRPVVNSSAAKVQCSEIPAEEGKFKLLRAV